MLVVLVFEVVFVVLVFAVVFIVDVGGVDWGGVGV